MPQRSIGRGEASILQTDRHFPRPCSTGTLRVKWGKEKLELDLAEKVEKERNCLRGSIPLFACQESLPDGDEQAVLQIAGLGEKKVSIHGHFEGREIDEELVKLYD